MHCMYVYNDAFFSCLRNYDPIEHAVKTLFGLRLAQLYEQKKRSVFEVQLNEEIMEMNDHDFLF